jgi:hypothetical protein
MQAPSLALTKIGMLCPAFGTKQEQEARFSLDFHQVNFIDDC